MGMNSERQPAVGRLVLSSLAMHLCHVADDGGLLLVLCAELPRVPARFLWRPHAVGAWMAHPVCCAPPAGKPDQAPQPHPLLEEHAEEPSEAQVAAEDPLCGLLQMQARHSTFHDTITE